MTDTAPTTEPPPPVLDDRKKPWPAPPPPPPPEVEGATLDARLEDMPQPRTDDDGRPGWQ